MKTEDIEEAISNLALAGNAKTNQRHHHYVRETLRNLADGQERSTKECHHFIPTKRSGDAAGILSNIQSELTERRCRFRLRKRRDGIKVFWRLVEAVGVEASGRPNDQRVAPATEADARNQKGL